MNTELETKLTEIGQEVASVNEMAGQLAVKSEQDEVTATDFLVKIKARLTRVEELRTFFVKPLNDQVKAINAKFKEQSEPLEKAYASVKRLVSDYRLEQDDLARAEEKRLADLKDAKNERRAEAGKPLDLTPAPTIERAPAVVSTEAGKTVAKRVWKYRVIDINLVPREYLRCEVKDAVIKAEMSKGVRAIAGLEFYEDFDLSVSAK